MLIDFGIYRVLGLAAEVPHPTTGESMLGDQLKHTVNQYLTEERCKKIYWITMAVGIATIAAVIAIVHPQHW